MVASLRRSRRGNSASRTRKFRTRYGTVGRRRVRKSRKAYTHAAAAGAAADDRPAESAASEENSAKREGAAITPSPEEIVTRATEVAAVVLALGDALASVRGEVYERFRATFRKLAELHQRILAQRAAAAAAGG